MTCITFWWPEIRCSSYLLPASAKKVSWVDWRMLCPQRLLVMKEWTSVGSTNGRQNTVLCIQRQILSIYKSYAKLCVKCSCEDIVWRKDNTVLDFGWVSRLSFPGLNWHQCSTLLLKTLKRGLVGKRNTHNQVSSPLGISNIRGQKKKRYSFPRLLCF